MWQSQNLWRIRMKNISWFCDKQIDWDCRERKFKSFFIFHDIYLLQLQFWSFQNDFSWILKIIGWFFHDLEVIIICYGWLSFQRFSIDLNFTWSGFGFLCLNCCMRMEQTDTFPQRSYKIESEFEVFLLPFFLWVGKIHLHSMFALAIFP